ncbi:hypothetical protein G7Z17_g5551 [Cylindrodendrum hubeiense]|uniref:Cystathionine gamma-synthase n=1 Tax=Cylindrodendrum hubeiense TaxID=595255 RepID=A0A9P5LG20_9HYPO|nr:hypothetical protein G7Z17_g5551 [Cylindrodendrum hubeiense]
MLTIKAVSVYLPTWQNTVNWAMRDPELLALMKTGYPRFFVPLIVRELGEHLVQWAASKTASETPNEESTKLLAAPALPVFTMTYTQFLYVDTFKVLSKVYGFDCKLYGHASPSDMDQLEADLTGGLQIDALYTEFPGNPLLGSVDLERLYRLSKKHDFLFIVDDTVATSVNVSLLSFCDVVCTSLTKLFSGGCNVMGGSVVLNPQSERFQRLQQTFTEQYVDTYFPEDVLVMEKNSADFEKRVITASQNAERVAQMLRRHATVSQVFYPKGNPTQDIYDRYKQPGKGYGYLLSVRFEQPEAAIAFHDALNVAKGPSLGTNFTLCCAYTLFAHFSELEWAAQYGVVEHLVRISVGIEDGEHLDDLVQRALQAATERHRELRLSRPMPLSL